MDLYSSQYANAYLLLSVYHFEGVVWASEATFNSDIIKIHSKQYFMVAWKVVFVESNDEACQHIYIHIYIRCKPKLRLPLDNYFWMRIMNKISFRFSFRIKIHWDRKCEEVRHLKWYVEFFIISCFFISGCLCIGFYKTLCYISIWSKPLFNLGDGYLFFNIAMYIVCIWICSTFSSHFINKISPQNIFKENYFTRKNDKNCIKLFVMNWIIL